MQIFKKIACWSLLFLLATLSILQAQEKNSKDTEKSCQDFVQGFYNWLVKEDHGPINHVIKDKHSAFTPELFQLLKEDTEAQDKAEGEIVGLDFDPFFNSQDPGERYVAGEVKRRDDHYLVDVYGIWSGEKSKTPSVVPELIFHRGRWVFVNFHYGKSDYPENENLISVLQELRKDRQKHDE